MENQQESKQHAIGFVDWIVKENYYYDAKTQTYSVIRLMEFGGVCGSSEKFTGDELYQKFLDRNLSDVEKFRKEVLKEARKIKNQEAHDTMYKDWRRSGIQEIIEFIKNFKKSE